MTTNISSPRRKHKVGFRPLKPMPGASEYKTLNEIREKLNLNKKK